MAILMAIFSFLGGPVAKALVDSYNLKLKAGTTDKVTAAKLAGEEIGAQVAESNNIYGLRIAQIGHPFEPEKLAMYITLIYYGKIMVWDKVLADLTGGRTDPVGGYAAVWAGMIMAFYFTKRGAENVATIVKSLKG